MRNSATLVAVVFLVLAIFAHSGDRQSTAQVAPIPNALQQVPKVQNWEYQLIRVPTEDRSLAEARDRLTSEGQQGWEIFQAVPQDSVRSTLFILKRPGK